MSLRTSVFNKSIIKSDLKRCWWVSALELLALLMIVFAIIDNVTAPGAFVGATFRGSYLSGELLEVMSISFILQFTVPVFLTILLFGYLNKVSAVSCMHSLPLKRSELFFSHTASCIILSFAPIILCCAALLCTLALPNMTLYTCAGHILLFGVHSAIYALVSISFTAMICMLVGNMLAGIALTYIFALLPLYLEQLVRVLLDSFLYGYPSDWSDAASSLTLLYRSVFEITPLYMAMLIALSVLFTAVAMLLYRRRALENYGEIVAFSRLKPFFTFGAAICAGFMGFLYFRSITGKEHILYLLPFGIIGIIIAHMLMKRQLTLRGTLRPIVVYCVFMLAIFSVFKFDITGYEHRIPDAKSISSVRVYSSVRQYHITYNHNIDGEWYKMTEKSPYDPVVTDEEAIASIIGMHKYAVQNRRRSGTPYTLEYTLTSGKKILRTYYFNITGADKEAADLAAVKPVAMLEQVKAQKFSVMDKTEKYDMTFSVSDRRTASKEPTTVNDPDAVRKIADALILDLENISFEDYLADPYASALKLYFDYNRPLVCTNGRTLPEKLQGKEGYDLASENETYYIRPGYTNTIAVLRELGLLPQLPPASEVSSVSLRRSPAALTSSGEAAEVTDAVSSDSTAIVDRALTEQIYNFCCENPLTNKLDTAQPTCEITIKYNDGTKGSVVYADSLLPEFIKNIR